MVTTPRLIPRIAGRQQYTATPPGAPPRRLKTLVRASGDVATLGDFAPHACPRPASFGSRPLSGRDGYPRPPEAVLARHVPRRRVDRCGLPRTSQLSLCPTSGSPLEAPPHWTGPGIYTA